MDESRFDTARRHVAAGREQIRKQLRLIAELQQQMGNESLLENAHTTLITMRRVQDGFERDLRDEEQKAGINCPVVGVWQVPITGQVKTPSYWRERAEEARVIAARMRDPDAKRSMEQVASGYDALADRAEATGWQAN
jgi:hypothetical protein